MKILLATSSVTPNAGIPSYNREICSMLTKDNEMHLLVEENLYSYPGYSKVFSISKKNDSSYRDCSNLLLKINSEKYDLIINSNSHLMARLAPFLNDSTEIITVSHSLRYTDSDNAVFNNKYLDHIIALSEYNKKHIAHKWGVNNKVHVIYNFVGDVPNSQEIRDSKKKNDVMKIVYAGGTAPSKNPELVLRVLSELLQTDLQFQFVMMGVKTPPIKRYQPFSDVSMLIPNDDRIVFTGKIPRNEASKLIRECNIFFAPSRREGCPMALLEALSVGVIPIVSDYKIANKEIITDGENGFVINHKKVEEFVWRITDIIKNHSNYLSVYDKSFHTFQEKLSYAVWEEKMKGLIIASKRNHRKRKVKMSKSAFICNMIRFDLMHKCNEIEKILRETLPSAWRIYRMYKQCKIR